MVKLSSLGDVVHTLPALSDAVRVRPDIRFDWVIEEAFTELPALHCAVDQVIPVAIRRWRKNLLSDFPGPEWRRVRQRLRAKRYDAVIDAQGLLKSSFVAWQIDAPRFGFDKHSARERLAAFAYHHRISVPRSQHAITRTRQLFAHALDYPVPVTVADFGVRQKFQVARTQGKKRLVFCHGSARAEKLWPLENWVALTQRATAAGYVVTLPWGTEEEKLRARKIAERSDSAQVSVLPRLGLSAMAGELVAATAFVAVDTGLGHLGAALAVPGVSLYGPTDVTLVGTYGHKQHHERSLHAGSHGSMHSIKPEQVWESLQSLISTAASDSDNSSSWESRA